ncbi:MAG TPA: BON domain-containing protein [Pyrinomonadaceae bacterium]
MSSKTLLTILAGAALSLSAAACSSADNTNANANANANRAVNANAAATPTATPASTGSAYNRNYNTRDDFKKDDTSYREEAKKAGSTIGSGLEDGWIHLKVRGALAAVDDLRDSTINVDVDNNVVTLRGSVANAAGKAAAEKAAKVDGVTRVVNRLEIKAAGSSNTSNANTANANKKS